MYLIYCTSVEIWESTKAFCKNAIHVSHIISKPEGVRSDTPMIQAINHCPPGTLYGPYPGLGKFGVPSSFHVKACARIVLAPQPFVGSRMPW